MWFCKISSLQLRHEYKAFFTEKKIEKGSYLAIDIEMQQAAKGTLPIFYLSHGTWGIKDSYAFCHYIYNCVSSQHLMLKTLYTLSI